MPVITPHQIYTPPVNGIYSCSVGTTAQETQDPTAATAAPSAAAAATAATAAATTTATTHVGKVGIRVVAFGLEPLADLALEIDNQLAKVVRFGHLNRRLARLVGVQHIGTACVQASVRVNERMSERVSVRVGDKGNEQTQQSAYILR